MQSQRSPELWKLVQTEQLRSNKQQNCNKNSLCWQFFTSRTGKMLNDGLKRLELIFNLVPVYPMFSHCPLTSCFKSCKKFPTSDIMLQIFASAFFFPFSEHIPNFFSVFSHDLEGVWNIAFFFSSPFVRYCHSFVCFVKR